MDNQGTPQNPNIPPGTLPALARFYSYVEKRVKNKCSQKEIPVPLPKPENGLLAFFANFSGIAVGEILSSPFQRAKILLQAGEAIQFQYPKYNYYDFFNTMKCIFLIDFEKNKRSL